MIMNEEYAFYLATKHQCECIGAQTDMRGNVVFYCFNELHGGNKSTFTARNEAEFCAKLADRQRVAA